MGTAARKEIKFDPQRFSDNITVIFLIITCLSIVQIMRFFYRKEIGMFAEMQVLGPYIWVRESRLELQIWFKFYQHKSGYCAQISY
jgi:hypothetical protein